MDGLDALPDQKAELREYRDGASCAGLQHEASDQPVRRSESARSDLTGSFVSRKSIAMARIPQQNMVLS